MERPPVNPDDWSDEQWMEWLHATEDAFAGDDRVYAPRLDSPAGIVLGAAMLGLDAAIFGEVKRPEVIAEAEASGRDDGTKIDLDPDDPSASTVIVPGAGPG